MDFSFSYKKTPQGSGQPPPPQASPGEAQYQALKGCGLTLRPPKGWFDLCRGQNHEHFAKRPYARVLELMGGLNPDGEPWSDDVFFYKNPAAVDENELSTILTNVKRLMKDAFPLGDPMVSTNYETNALTATLDVNGSEETWEFDPAGDVVSQAFDKLGAAAASHDQGRVATLHVPTGTLVIYMNTTEVAELTDTTRLTWNVRG
ncbi:MAG: hypothetical protein HBSAPP03_07390 [Phycisphaerae bacterium]|nr:MAG: hypothetical protein HBSAPP03_07390 [Phycisphaerae bacterium]